MKTKKWLSPIGVAVLCLLASLLATPAVAVDKGVYEGEWATQAPPLSLKITHQDASFTVDGKTFTDPTPEYFYGQLATFPFLYLEADEAAQDPGYSSNEHRFYLIIGEDGNDLQGDPKLSLRGYYDYSRVRNDSNGMVESQSYPIQMERVGNAPGIQVPPVKAH